MSDKTTFKRYELKYLLTKSEYEDLGEVMKSHMKLDEYKRHKIRNIYYDTEDYKIIRNSLEKPEYKEKLRLRLYGDETPDSKVFIELKKKVKGIVYKRRIVSNLNDSFDFLNTNINTNNTNISKNSLQIKEEIEYFKGTYDTLSPKVYLAYEREAYHSLNDDELRVTFDFNIKMRDSNISFNDSIQDRYILNNDCVLLEVKTVYGLPRWMLDFFGENKIYQSSFSKYGVAYKKYILPEILKEREMIS